MEYAIMEIPLEFNIKNIYMFTTYRHQQIYVKAEYMHIDLLKTYNGFLAVKFIYMHAYNVNLTNACRYSLGINP